VEVDERSGRSRSLRTDENVEKVVQNLVNSDRRLSINQTFYIEILKLLREAVRRKRLGLWPNDGFSTMTMLQLPGRSL
jgi:hypothetical protein